MSTTEFEDENKSCEEWSEAIEQFGAFCRIRRTILNYGWIGLLETTSFLPSRRSRSVIIHSLVDVFLTCQTHFSLSTLVTVQTHQFHLKVTQWTALKVPFGCLISKDVHRETMMSSFVSITVGSVILIFIRSIMIGIPRDSQWFPATRSLV